MFRQTLEMIFALRDDVDVVGAVSSGDDAPDVCRQLDPDVVLVDYRMPGLNGVEAFRVIRESQPQTPVILMTAYAAPDLLTQAEREGVLQILPKPLPCSLRALP